jgi:DNA polymerase III epsilon subunit-like protein
MHYLIFDTETTGLPPRAPWGSLPIPADDPRQPRLASFAGIVVDGRGETVAEHKFYIRPEGWTMAEFDQRARWEGKTPASEINGLTDEFLLEHGVPVREVLAYYSGSIESGYIVAAFNAVFDTKIMRGELRRAGMPDLFAETKNICLMKACDAYASDGLCMSSPGFVKLSVACEFFGIVNEDAHDAMGDARATLGLFRRFLADGRLPEPKITHAANYAGAT